MSIRRTWAVTLRVLRQLRHDHRTIALIILVPVVLLTLLKWVFDANPMQFNRIGATLVGVFPLILMFIITSITMLRERTQGTLERLMSLPVGKADLIAGYAIAFGLVAALQGLVAAAVVLGPLDVTIQGSTTALLAATVANGVLGSSMGLFTSAFARSEFQAVQFMPIFVMPQLLLCGLFTPRERMLDALQTVSDWLPMTWSFDALTRVAQGADLGTSEVQRDLAILLVVTVAVIALGAATLRRRTP